MHVTVLQGHQMNGANITRRRSMHGEKTRHFSCKTGGFHAHCATLDTAAQQVLAVVPVPGAALLRILAFETRPVIGGGNDEGSMLSI
jgi:hypothetical protein